MSGGQRFAQGSLVAGCLVLGLKGAAWWLTGSAALYSDALESTVNVVASLLAWGAIALAERPADANHPYGHGKVEFFAAVVEGMLISVAAMLIFAEAWETWSLGRTLAMPFHGLGLNAIATGINAVWSYVLIRAGRRLRSPALAADGRHLLSDVVTSAGIAAGVFLAVLTGVPALDPLLAAATGIYVLWSGIQMISRSVNGLMDSAPEPAVVDRIKELVANSATGAIEAHDLRTRHAGQLSFLEFHLVVPGHLTVSEAHQICDRIEAALKAEMGHLLITIHVEPEEKAKHDGVTVR